MKVIIADDEPLARDRLNHLLSQLPDLQVVDSVVDGASALQACEEHQPDVILLDISMPGMDGLEVARQLATRATPPAIIFCTAYDDHALSAFDAAAVDYVVKPVRIERLQSAFDRARAFISGRKSSIEQQAKSRQRPHLHARLRNTVRMIPVEDIYYLQAEEKYVVVHHVRGEDLIEESLKSLEEEFGDRFIRIHRNCLVASDQLSELRREKEGKTFVVLRSINTPLEVSRRCYTAVKAIIYQR